MIQGEEEAAIQQYRTRNNYLRKQLREKDLRIMELFGSIQQASSRLTSTPHSQLTHNYHTPTTQRHSSRKVQISYSERKRIKERSVQSPDSSNIFKQQNFSLVEKNSHEDLRLPALDKRTKVEFTYPREDSIIENPEGRAKIVRIPLDRLKPLNSKQVKKRFLMKFQMREQSQGPE